MGLLGCLAGAEGPEGDRQHLRWGSNRPERRPGTGAGWTGPEEGSRGQGEPEGA